MQYNDKLLQKKANTSIDEDSSEWQSKSRSPQNTQSSTFRPI